VRVLLLTSAAISSALSLIMVFFLRRHREHAGFAHWTVASSLVSLMFLASGLRGLVPTVASVLLVNASTLAAAPLYLDGTRRFFARRGLDPRWYAVSAAALAVNLYFTFVREDIGARTLVLAMVSGGWLTAAAALALHERRARPSLLVGALATQLVSLSVVMVARAAWVTGRSGFTLFTETPAQFGFFGAITVLHLGVTITYVLMTTERVANQLGETGIELAARVEQLERTLAEVKTLRGLLPICASCKRIRDEHDHWIQMEVFVRDRSQAEFSHGLCPDCLPKYLSLPPRAPGA